MTKASSRDGNGRTGRLLINYILLKKNISPIVIPVDYRSKYLSYMENNDIDSLESMFKELLKKENARIKDFIEMQENN